MTDIVERLRDLMAECPDDPAVIVYALHDAANEIERLRRENDELQSIVI